MNDPLIVGIRWGLYLTLSIAFGVPLFALHAMAPARQTMLPLRGLVGLSAAAALMLTLIGWVAMTAAMADKPLAGVARDDLMAMLAMPGLGASWLVRVGSLVALVLAASIIGLRRLLLVLGTVLGGAALGSLAWSGHGATGDGSVGRLHLLADVVHLLAAGAWVGALIGLSLLLWRAAREPALTDVANTALASFGPTGTIIVTAIVGTGLINSWVLVGRARVLDLPTTLWGQLLLVKLGLFTVMLGFAAVNRWIFSPADVDPTNAAEGAMVRMRRSVALETGVALLVLAVVAWLGTLLPPSAL